jgi:hypothetical protein
MLIYFYLIENMVMATNIGLKCLVIPYTSILLVYGFTGDHVSTDIPVVVLRSISDEYFAVLGRYIYNTCALSKHIGNMCMRLRNGGKGEASPSLFPCFAPNTHIYLYASTVHMYCIYPAILNRK